MKTNVQGTSRDAYYEIKPELGDRQRFVLNFLKTQIRPVTNSEISVQLKVPINQITPRIFELRQKGFVVSHGKKRCSVTGRVCLTWAIGATPDDGQGELPL